MMTFDEPPALFVTPRGAPPRMLEFRDYVLELVLSRPYWRSTDEACSQAEELLDHFDRLATTYVLRDGTHEKLQEQMREVDAMMLMANPHLVRASIRFTRVVNQAKKYVEPEQKAAE